MKDSSKASGKTSNGKAQNRKSAAAARVKQTAGGSTRTRTFTGCRTCRSRHLKCDETRPVCSTCQRLNLDCEGYEANLYWLPDQLDKQAHRATSFRYPLFTEEARHSMSVDIVQSLGAKTAGDALLVLDTEDPPGSDCRRLGPFGVFRGFEAPLSPSSPSPDCSPQSPSRQEASPLPSSPSYAAMLDYNSPAGEDADVIEIETADPRGDGPPDTHADIGWNYLDSLQDHWLDMDHSHPETSRMLSIDTSAFDMLFPPSSPPILLSVDPRTPKSLPSPQTIQDISDTTTEIPRSVACAPQAVPASISHCGQGVSASNVPAHADSLLRHYREAVLEASSSCSGKRTSPWQLFLLPCALETFAELALWNTASHTRYSILYSLLSNSAFHLHGSLQPAERQRSPWLGVATNHQEMAKRHLKQALQTEFSPSSQVKYSDLLMAILALAMVSTFNGSHVIKVLLLDAEGLIRLRGLPNPKTFKTRVFHHMYTHLRLLNESITAPTETTAETQLSVRRPQQAVELSKFHIPEDSDDVEFDLSQDKPSEIGYNDIHLEVPGKFPPTLYPEMYGIPESLMTLLSRTISLANEMSRKAKSRDAIPPHSSDLSHHIRTLEKHLWSWSLDSGAARPDHLADQDALVDQPHTRAMVLALHQALMLYFYRRIHNISAMLLQSMVQTTFEHLKTCHNATLEGQDFAATVAWSGFIAACEAATPELQDRARGWLESIDSRGIFFGVERPGELAQKIWEQRERCKDWSISWPELMRTAISA